ncbi:MAG: hypothetical protein H3Z52_10225 [archaeon]|nr:hypothetical protein [archaeon]
MMKEKELASVVENLSKALETLEEAGIEDKDIVQKLYGRCERSSSPDSYHEKILSLQDPESYQNQHAKTL